MTQLTKLKVQSLIKLITRARNRINDISYPLNDYIIIGLHKPKVEVIWKKFSFKNTSHIKKYLQNKLDYNFYRVDFNAKDGTRLGYGLKGHKLRLVCILLFSNFNGWNNYKNEKVAVFPIIDISEIK
ncbi:hypothetical protein J4211_05920 [Candidatus Woesearchaeota archaeon]|nr:hypothetical protein [Candidatus Woesearchaeota archaeon]